MTAVINVFLKEGVLDPQGKAASPFSQRFKNALSLFTTQRFWCLEMK